MLGLSIRRWPYLSKVKSSVLHRCWQAGTPAAVSDWQDISFLVCDAEMSALNPSEGELLSMGWLVIESGAVVLSSARHRLLQARHSVGQSAAIHQLRDCELREGLPPAEVLEEFLIEAAGKILVFHNAALDTAYLNGCCREYFGAPLLMPTVDTMALEHARLSRQDKPMQSGDLRLQACRKRYNLPAYPGHNALVDALATAELLIAQAKHRAGKGALQLRDFLT